MPNLESGHKGKNTGGWEFDPVLWIGLRRSSVVRALGFAAVKCQGVAHASSEREGPGEKETQTLDSSRGAELKWKKSDWAEVRKHLETDCCVLQRLRDAEHSNVRVFDNKEQGGPKFDLQRTATGKARVRRVVDRSRKTGVRGAVNLSESVTELRHRITAAVALVNRDMLERVWGEMDYRKMYAILTKVDTLSICEVSSKDLDLWALGSGSSLGDGTLPAESRKNGLPVSRLEGDEGQGFAARSKSPPRNRDPSRQLAAVGIYPDSLL
ncbi:hypothetical protein ANN_08452 [Periplaneta americana]|uniref:Uncharacterized protein n=1 Tax=Periplaneta americana TaxID=6978 RepID=A0ABQ8T2V6_PERAM|nr:hypothetical protein ANN_08452 [Periplaneta americana]